VLVLCYHAVGEHWPTELSVRPARLGQQLASLLARGYRGATFHEAVIAPPHRRTLAVTFDDAYRSVIELAEPILSHLGLVGTVFASTSFIGSGAAMSWAGIEGWLGGPHEAELMPMSWPELDWLACRGWEVGSHGSSHRRMTELDDAALERELRDSRVACEQRLSRPCMSIAYPYGDVDARVVAAARDAGYRTGAALPSRWHRPRPLETPRIGVYRGDAGVRFRLKTSRAVRRVRVRS
jgi:peptidoglycan/xylan/chitin deacetylase (PgdA/CDA1 family)